MPINNSHHSYRNLGMDVQHFFDKDTSTLSYIVYDKDTRDAVIIDPVLNFDLSTGVIEDHSMKELVAFITKHNLNPLYSMETHAHADHMSSSRELKNIFPNIKIAISENIKIVQKSFKDVLGLEDSFKMDGSQFDKLIKNDETFNAGSISIHAIPTPGHTPACLSYHIENMVFCGDALFVPDLGTGRCDFPEGCADALYTSVHERLYKLPDDTIIFTGHDYCPNGRELKIESTIGVSKRQNGHLKEETKREDYIKFREARDKTLPAPKLLFASIQVNIDGGTLPKALKVPLTKKLSS